MWPGSISTRYRRRLATNSSRNPPSDRLGDITRPRGAWVSLDVNIIGVAGAQARLGLGSRRAPQIALSPAEWTRVSSLIIPSSIPRQMDCHDLSRAILKSARLRSVPSPSLPGGPPDRRQGSAPARQAGKESSCGEQTGVLQSHGEKIAAPKVRAVARTLAGGR